MTDSGMDIHLQRAMLMARSVWNRRWLVIGVSSVMALLLCSAVSFVPNRYQASARVYVDTQTVLKPLMAGLAYQPDIEQQVRMLANTLISRPNVERILETHDFGWEISGSTARQKLVNELMEKVKVEGGGSSNLYVVTFRDTNPDRARRLVEAIVDLFMHSSSGEKKRDSQDASRFIADQIKDYESKLVEAESRVKEFKVRNFGVTGTQTQDYFGRMSTLSDQVNKLGIDLAAAERSRDSYRRELATEEPQAAGLTAQRRVLEDLLRRYTDAHPEVVAARQSISELQARGGAAGKQSVAATSPVYQRIRMSLADAEAQVASLASQYASQKQQLEQARAIAGRVPQVESELAQLNRDYDVIRKNYELLVARRESASLGIKMDQSSQLAEFRLIEPPRVAPTPVFPGRTQLGLIAILVSLLSGIAVSIGLDLLRPTLQDVKSLRLLSGRPVLGAVSVALVGDSATRSRAEAIRYAGAVTAFLALQIAWMAWIATRPTL